MGLGIVLGLIGLVAAVVVGAYLHLSRRARLERSVPSAAMFVESELAGRVDTFFPSDDLSRDASAVFSRDELFTVSNAHTPLDLDPRRKAAVLQQFDIQHGQKQLWRESSRGQFLEISDHREALILDRLVGRSTAESSLKALVGRRAGVEDALGAGATQVDLLWPGEVIVGFDGGIEGYIAPALSPEFLAMGRGSKPFVRTLNFSRRGPRGKSDPVEATARLELVQLVAAWLRALHGANVIHGGLNLSSLAFVEGPGRVAALDYSSARVLGHGPWSDTSIDSSLDIDRKAMAQIAFALLVPDGTLMADWRRFPEIVPGLGEDQPSTERLRWLWARASGDAGSMPTVEEWAAALAPVDSSII